MVLTVITMFLLNKNFSKRTIVVKWSLLAAAPIRGLDFISHDTNINN